MTYGHGCDDGVRKDMPCAWPVRLQARLSQLFPTADVRVANRAKPLPPPMAPLPDDPGKRIASLVPGEPGYLVTADGSRYFVGAVLPSGHRVTAIAQQRVTLERDGQSQTLNF